jgi:hypothetical protein
VVASGVWRFGAVNLTGWTNRSTSDHLVGTVDEIAAYHTQLQDIDIKPPQRDDRSREGRPSDGTGRSHRGWILRCQPPRQQKRS